MKQLHEYPTPITDIAAIWYAAEFDAGRVYDLPPGVHVAQARDMERRLGMCMGAMDSACAMLASAHMTTDARDVAMRVGDALRVATAAANWTPSGRPEAKKCPRCGRVVAAPCHTCLMPTADRAAIVLQQIDEMLALAEKAQIESVETMMEHISINAEAWVDVQHSDIAAFIAASSTGYPLALRCLKTAIEVLMDAPDGDDTARNALAAICGQWEAGL